MASCSVTFCRGLMSKKGMRLHIEISWKQWATKPTESAEGFFRDK